MIDLRYKDLPQAIEVNGRSFLINTDFRAWIKVGELFKQDATLDQYLFLFTKDIPTDPVFIQAVQQFFYNPNVTPKFSDDSGIKSIDAYGNESAHCPGDEFLGLNASSNGTLDTNAT